MADYLVGTLTEQDGELLTQVLVGEPARDKNEHQHRIENSLRIGVAEAQRGCPLALDLTRSLQMLEGVVAQRAVVTDLLDLKQPRLAAKPMRRSSGRFFNSRPTPKSRVSLMVVSVLKAGPSLWYCLMRERL